MATHTTLRQLLHRIDQQNYKAYKALQGSYEFPGFTLSCDRIQSDPFAAPSQCSVKIPQARAGFAANLFSNRSREIALRDYLTRQFDRAARSQQQRRGSGSSGLLAIAAPGQTVLARSAVLVDADQVEVRFAVGLPAVGRRVAGRQAVEMLCEDVPQLVDRALLYQALDIAALQQHIETAEDADYLRDRLAERGLVAFVADGAVLARRSGVDDRPLRDHSLPFQAPDCLRVAFTCPHRGKVTGLGIPAGITLIVGGGYHGKSTLLRAIALGIYNHIPGDGREWVVSHPGTVKIRAEAGRSVTQVNLSPLINHLPQGRSTTAFSTPNASGSTAQAASILEALEVGAQVLLIDEDTAATNLMIRDRRMQALIAKPQEPITPLIDKVRPLYTQQGVSTILVMGGSGDYFDVADTVIAMQAFVPQDVTAQAKQIAQDYPSDRVPEAGNPFGEITPRRLASRQPRNEEGVKCKVRGLETIVLGNDAIDLSGVEQIVEPGQLRAIAAALVYLQQHYLDGNLPLAEILDSVFAELEAREFAALTDSAPGDFAAFRRFELAAALNRWRSLGEQVAANASES